MKDVLRLLDQANNISHDPRGDQEHEEGSQEDYVLFSSIYSIVYLRTLPKARQKQKRTKNRGQVTLGALAKPNIASGSDTNIGAVNNTVR